MLPKTDLLTDAQLTDAVAARLTRPKADGVTSFTLHAPLELLARTALLPLVEPTARDAARDRLAWLGDAYAEAGAEVDEPAPRAYDDLGTAVAHLVAAIDAGDLDDADATAAWLAERATPDELARHLADDVVPRLAAAGHGSILLYLLPRVAPRSRAAARPLRGLVRELARFPDWGLTWQRDRSGEPRVGGDLVAALRRPRSPGDPGSDFIFPTMSLVESSGLAEELLDGPTRTASVAQAGRDLLRLAAASMVQDDPAAAPYGWSHCLTMPQAVLGLARTGAAEPSAAIAVAATFVLGFRSTQARVVVDPAWAPEPAGDPLDALEGTPAEAAAGAWHATTEQRPAVVARLASWAAAHEDAHLAKYTLACFDA
ncbi:MAG TPA: hypothetical protein VD926_08400, partial [Acidimicrobiales bacterium]|nr:hypothetical protein [Acidimicrobiales bacterium]